MIRGFDIEAIADTGALRVVAIEGIGVFYIKDLESLLKLFKVLLYNQVKDLCAYNMDYDITGLIKFIYPKRFYQRIYRGIPTEYKGITIRYIPNKKCTLTQGRLKLRIYDCFQFYKMSLARASVKYLGKEKIDYDIVKLSEQGYIDNLTTIFKYCYNDSVLCGELFRLVFDKVKAVIGKGPELISQGYVAYQYFREQFIRNKVKPFNLLFRLAFRGGRFEIFKRGVFRNVYAYDINSAYPEAFRKLPCLEDCFTVRNSEYMEKADFSLFHLNRVFIPLDLIISPIVYKINQKNIYPVGLLYNIWIDKNDMDCLLKVKAKIDIKEAYHIFTNKDLFFKDKIDYLYKHKLNFPADNEIYKIMLNSIFGKTSQEISSYKRISFREVEAKYSKMFIDRGDFYLAEKSINNSSNFIYASYITSYTRKKLFLDSFPYQSRVIMLATDSIVLQGKLPLPLSNRLGAYKLKRFYKLIVIGSGVYCYKENKSSSWRLTFRGFNVSNPEKIISKILNSGVNKVRFKLKERISLGKALIQKRTDELNLILETVKVLDLNFDKKRIWLERIKKGKDLNRKTYLSKPFPFC